MSQRAKASDDPFVGASWESRENGEASWAAVLAVFYGRTNGQVICPSLCWINQLAFPQGQELFHLATLQLIGQRRTIHLNECLIKRYPFSIFSPTLKLLKNIKTDFFSHFLSGLICKSLRTDSPVLFLNGCIKILKRGDFLK